MPTILRVIFRRDGRDDDSHLVHAFAEDLDLDALTPRARALAEALHESMQEPHGPGHNPLDVLFESDLINAELAELPPKIPAAYGSVSNPDERAQRVIRWAPLLSATADSTLVEWLEGQARQIPQGWYPIGVRNRPRVPSWEAGAADRYLTRDQMLDRLRTAGAPISPQAWNTLRNSGYLAPDRYVCRQPQWHPDTVDAHLAQPCEQWTLTRAAEHLGIAPASARVQLRRWGLDPVGRGPGRGGESLYDAAQVRAAHAHRPGRGARTDLHDRSRHPGERHPLR